MNIVNDHQNHGYTKDDDGNIWYWKVEDGELTFRDYGYPVEHPIKKTGEVDPEVREVTERWAARNIPEMAADERAEIEAEAELDRRREEHFDRHGYY